MPSNTNPDGIAPELVHVYGAVPPLAVNCWLYEYPTFNPVTVDGEIVITDAAATVTE